MPPGVPSGHRRARSLAQAGDVGTAARRGHDALGGAAWDVVIDLCPCGRDTSSHRLCQAFKSTWLWHFGAALMDGFDLSSLNRSGILYLEEKPSLAPPTDLVLLKLVLH